jgi:hypothetical protein
MSIHADWVYFRILSTQTMEVISDFKLSHIIFDRHQHRVTPKQKCFIINFFFRLSSSAANVTQPKTSYANLCVAI